MKVVRQIGELLKIFAFPIMGLFLLSIGIYHDYRKHEVKKTIITNIVNVNDNNRYSMNSNTSNTGYWCNRKVW